MQPIFAWHNRTAFFLAYMPAEHPLNALGQTTLPSMLEILPDMPSWPCPLQHFGLLQASC